MRRALFDGSFSGWKEAARRALSQAIPPDELVWVEAAQANDLLDLFSNDPLPKSDSVIRVPKKFLHLSEQAASHSNPARWSLLYRLLWRLNREAPDLLENPADPDVIALHHYEKEVRKDAYRMTAFLRFREVPLDDGVWFVAWYEPEHRTLEMNSKFFIDRFYNMRWSILTPRRCMHWDGRRLSFSEGVSKSKLPERDRVEPLWIAYYSNIFNPARLKIRAMQAQLLKRNWKNLPEAAVIEPLLKASTARVEQMLDASQQKTMPTTTETIALPPAGASLAQLKTAAESCRACPLWKNATCTVFGEGPAHARLMLVGEQPGDQEDREGRVFIGPAGQLLNHSLAAAGLDRSELYLTNAVKHFKWEPRGKRRLHQTPNGRDIAACRPWLEAEIMKVKPALIVCLGTTAAKSVVGSSIKIMRDRGSVVPSSFGIPAFVTVHPSYMLRLPPGEEADRERAAFIRDLQTAREALKRLAT